jgi:hypothetical protein
MLIPIPKQAPPALWEGTMELEESLPARDGAAPAGLRELPLASIGRPETWPLASLYQPPAMPAGLRAKLAQSDFHLARFACSFRATDAAGAAQRLVWARFTLELLPRADGVAPIAFDLYPLAVTREAKRSRTLTLSPSLKFESVEVGVGELAFGLEYPQQDALVSAAGAGESIASWDYTALKGMPIHGVQWMYALIESPRGFGPLHAVLDLAADLAAGNAVLRLLGIRDAQRARSQLSVQLA